MTVVCPRCNTDEYTPYEERYRPGDPMPPALSRTDNATYICSRCGTDEAIRDYRGLPPIPPDDWPVR